VDEATVITLLGQSVAARARQLGRFMRAQRLDRTRRIGVLIGVAQSDAETQAWVATFRKRLDELGWRVGRNLQIDERWSASDPDQIRVFAGELVAMKPDARSSPTSSSLSAA
jgi:putative ABC transport system substrate-binding protein